MRGLVCAALLALAVAGCGAERQDADEPEGEFALEIVAASFPASQSIAESSTLTLEVRNTDDRELPNLAVTIETDGGGAFAQDAEDERLADASRPVWVLDSGPEGGTTAYTNTWATGPLFPGRARTLEWDVTAVAAGSYTVRYSVSPGLDGKAVPASGQETTGSFRVTIADDPVPARVGEDGEVVRGEKAGSGGD